MDDLRPVQVDVDATSTDDVLSDSVERVRSSRQLMDQIEEQLARGQRLLEAADGEIDVRDPSSGRPR